MAKCIIHNCNLETYHGDDKCVLHTHEGKNEGFTFSYVFQDFYNALVEHIVERVFARREEQGCFCKETIKIYLETGKCFRNDEISQILKDLSIVFLSIVFPDRDEKYPQHDYLDVLVKLGGILFNGCEFLGHSLDLRPVKCFYRDCIFHEFWLIDDLRVLPDVSNSIYQNCSFKENVSAYSESGRRSTINNPVFSDCQFSKQLQFENVDFTAPLFSNMEKFNTKMTSIELTDCCFKDRFVLNNCTIEYFGLEKTIFEFKFEFKNNIVDEYLINNVIYFSAADHDKTVFQEFSMQQINFEKFAGFEYCTFGIENNASINLVAYFSYVTFSAFANFRNAQFLSGLDFELVNYSVPPNFLNVQIPLLNTNRETFRIVKDSFQKTGNNIEANKYFVKEMKKYKEELALKRKWWHQDRFIVCLNEKISDFGQSYFRPAVLIIITAVLYTILITGYEQNWLYKIHPPANNGISWLVDHINNVFGNILPFSSVLVLKSGMEFVSFIFYIIFAVLIWQTLIAVKRHVRR